MQRLQEGRVLLSGLQGLGAEVAKNLVLMGVGSLTLHDPQPTCWADLAAQVRSREASQTGVGGVEGGGAAGAGSPCSGWAGSLSSSSSRSRTWQGAGRRHLKKEWPSSTEPSRSASTQATSPRTCCGTSRCTTPRPCPRPRASQAVPSPQPADPEVRQVVVLTASGLEEQLEVGSWCRKHGVCFLVADTRGLVG